MNPKDSERLSRYLDGELTPDESRAVEELLATSPEAREEYTIMKQIHEATRDTLPAARFERPHVSARRARPLFRLAAAAAIAVLLGGVVFGAVKVYEALVAETVSSAAPGAPPPASEEPSIPAAVAEDSTQPAAQAALPTEANAAQAAADEGAAAKSSGGLSVPPLTGVVTSVTGEPISGAAIRARAWEGITHPYGLDGDPVRAVARSDANGHFALDWPADARCLRIGARGYESCTLGYSGAVLAPKIELHVKLLPETVYTGRVVDAAGNPIAEVRVAAEGAEDPAHDVAVTDAEGQFSVAARAAYGALYFSHPNYALTWIQRVASPEPVQATLTPGASLRLRVMQGSQPVPGAVVQVASEIPEALGYAMRRETDETGCVVFHQVPPDPEVLAELAVVVTAPNGVKGRLMEVPNLQPGATAETVLTLPDGYPGEVSGTVVDAEGNPLAGIPVVVGTPEDIAICSRTNESGVYTAGLPFGESQVFIARDLLAPGQFVAKPGGNRLQVNKSGATFTQNFTISSVKKDVAFVRSGGAPVEEVWLQLWPVLPTGFRGFDDSVKWKVATAAGHIQTLCAQIYRGYAYDPAGEQVAFVGAPEDLTEVTVVFNQPAGAIAGRVVDPSGKPLAAASVSASSSAEGYPSAYVWSDAEGRFRIEALPMDSTCWLGFSLRGYQLLPGSLVAGLQPQRDPVAAEYVMAPQDAGLLGQVLAADGSALPRTHLMLTDRDRFLKSTYSAVDGTFYFEVAEGSYTLWALAPAMDAITSMAVTAPSQGNVVTLPVASPPPISNVPAPQGRESERASNNFKQMGLVFKMYANESQGALFPPLEAQDGVFTPEFKKIYPEYLTDTTVLYPNDGITRCYFAHAVTSEAQGMAFLDAVQQLGIAAVRDQDIQVGAGKGTAGGEVIFRLNEGLANQVFPDAPAGMVGSMMQASIPVLWEVPGEREESGGWVLYMDGHVQWQPYPGPFPMTEAFVTRIRGVLGLAN